MDHLHTDDLDLDKINLIGQKLKNESTHSQNEIANAVINMSIEAPGKIEEKKQSEEEYEDVGMDSYYPLMTTDPTKKKEYTLKITDNKLNNAFDHSEDPKFNLQSIYIQENYIGGKK